MQRKKKKRAQAANHKTDAEKRCCPHTCHLTLVCTKGCWSHTVLWSLLNAVTLTAKEVHRFETVVEQLKSREADELWVSLGNCDIEDSKIASLTEALNYNATVTAVDLSRNSITATGAQVGPCTFAFIPPFMQQVLE